MEPNEYGSDQPHDLLGACHDCIQEAIQFESEGNLEQAFDHYQNGLEFLMLAIRFAMITYPSWLLSTFEYVLKLRVCLEMPCMWR